MEGDELEGSPFAVTIFWEDAPGDLVGYLRAAAAVADNDLLAVPAALEVDEPIIDILNLLRQCRKVG